LLNLKNERLKDSVGGVDGEGVREYQVDAEQEFGDFQKYILGEAVNYKLLVEHAKVSVVNESKGQKQNTEGQQGSSQNSWKIFLALCLFHDWEDHADPLEAVEAEANHIPHVEGVDWLELVWVQRTSIDQSPNCIGADDRDGE